MKAILALLILILASCVPRERPEQVKVNSEFVTEYTVDGYYDKMAIADMDNDGFADIVLFKTESGKSVITVVRNVVGPWVSNDKRGDR